MKKSRLLSLIAAFSILIVAGCSEEEKVKPKNKTQQNTQTSNTTSQNTQTQSTKVAGLPLIKSAEAKLKSTKGSLFSLIGNQSLSLQDAANPMVNQIEFTGKESKSPINTIHLSGKLNQETVAEIYLTDDTVYEKIKTNPWSKRSTQTPRRNPADSIIIMNKLMKTLSAVHQENGLEANKQGETFLITVNKQAFSNSAIEDEIKKYQQKAIESEVLTKSPDKKVEAVTIDNLKLSITINEKTNQYTKISTTIQTSYKVNQTVHVVEETIEKSWGESFDVPLSIPNEVKNAPVSK